jgi:hypothetical protein
LSYLSDAWSKVCGKPDPAVAPGLRFTTRSPQWEVVRDEIGAGWFMNRFLYLFGEELEQFRPCLDAWSFVVPPGHPDRMIIGRNAYGALLVLENGNDISKESVHLLDPLNVQYWTHPEIVLVNLFGNYIPRGRLPNFLDHDAYDQWLAENGNVELEPQDILGVKKPLPLGGELEPGNLQLENIVEYYQTTGPIYAKAFASLRGS